MSSQRTKAIAHRVAGATLQNQTGFALPPNATGATPQVNLEEEMMKSASNQMDYAAVTSLYSKSLHLLKTAIGKG